MNHNANYVRENADGLKVCGHQASCTSKVTLITALYGHALRTQDRVAIKPHAVPVSTPCNTWSGATQLTGSKNFRGYGGAHVIAKGCHDIDIFAVTSAERLHAGWQAAQAAGMRGTNFTCHIERLLAPLPCDCLLVAVIDGHPTTM